MDQLIQQLQDALMASFPGAELDLEKASGKISGLLIWEGFVEQEQIDRQHRMWEVLRKKFNREEQLRISAILTMTPDEVAAMREA